MTKIVKDGGCEGFAAGDMMIFQCSRGSQTSRRCDSCSQVASVTCDFPLRGSREGQTCGRPLCSSCSQATDGKHFCRPHASLYREEMRGRKLSKE